MKNQKMNEDLLLCIESQTIEKIEKEDEILQEIRKAKEELLEKYPTKESFRQHICEIHEQMKNKAFVFLAKT